jgi:sugar-specific transcriptional regulator TrmB
MDAREFELLGLTEYEMKVYRALLSEHPVTAYRLGKQSGVPLSRVYEVTNRLVEKGAATIHEGEPARYSPVAPLTLVEGARHSAERRLDALGAELATLYKGDDNQGHAWVRGEDAVSARSAALVASATEEVWVAAAPMAQERLQVALDRANPNVRRNRISLQAMGRGDTTFVFVTDFSEAMIGRLGADAEALVTRHPSIVRIVEDYLQLRHMSEPPTESPRWLDWEYEKQQRLLQRA